MKFHHFTMSAVEVCVFGNKYILAKLYRNGTRVFKCKEPKCESKIKVDENTGVSRMIRMHNHKPHYLEREFYVCGEAPSHQKKKKKNDEEKPTKTCREESLKTEDAKMTSD